MRTKLTLLIQFKEKYSSKNMWTTFPHHFFKQKFVILDIYCILIRSRKLEFAGSSPMRWQLFQLRGIRADSTLQLNRVKSQKHRKIEYKYLILKWRDRNLINEKNKPENFQPASARQVLIKPALFHNPVFIEFRLQMIGEFRKNSVVI